MKPLLFAVLGLLGSVAAFAAEAPVRWSVTLSKAGPAVGEEIEIVVSAQIAPHWIVYSNDFKAEIGPQPTEFSFGSEGSFQAIGPVIPIDAKRGKDKAWETDYTYFSERGVFRQKVKVLATPVHGELFIKGQLCNERDGTCTLFKETLKL